MKDSRGGESSRLTGFVDRQLVRSILDRLRAPHHLVVNETSGDSDESITSFDPNETSNDTDCHPDICDTADSSNPEILTYNVEGIDCGSCASKIERAVKQSIDPTDVEMTATTGRLRVETDDIDSAGSSIPSVIEDLGYRVTETREQSRSIVSIDTVWRSRRGGITAIGAVSVTLGILIGFFGLVPDGQLFMVVERPLTVSDGFFVIAASVAGLPIIRDGLRSLRAYTLDIGVLMSVGIVASVASFHPFEGAMLAVLFSIATLLERQSMNRAKRSFEELMELSPTTATVRRNREESIVPIESVDIGDTVVVRPGETIPVDGTVTHGESSVDQAPITGESRPITKAIDEEVFAGTINGSGYLEVRAERPADESTVSRILELVEDAQRGSTKREQFVDRFARIYTPIVVVAAVLLVVLPPTVFGGSWDTWFLRGLALLVIACPCALVISTPVSVVSGITSGAKQGVLVKSGRYLESMSGVETIAFDKTGTLTTGELSVDSVITVGDAPPETVLEIAGMLERRSEHPIARAILDEVADYDIDIDDECVESFEAIAGSGVMGQIDAKQYFVGSPSWFQELGIMTDDIHRTDGGVQMDGSWIRECTSSSESVNAMTEYDGKTVVLIASEDRLLGALHIADRLRERTKWTIDRLHERGIRTLMVTGDNAEAARAVANAAGIDEVHAELQPEDKLDLIESRRRTGETIAMVGDGINDAPALSAASVGIAMGAIGSDTALETADIALMADEIDRLPYLLTLSGRTNSVIRENIWSSLAVKAVLAIGAPFGFVTVIHAIVIGDMGMSLGVTTNAMRLANVTPERAG